MMCKVPHQDGRQGITWMIFSDGRPRRRFLHSSHPCVCIAKAVSGQFIHSHGLVVPELLQKNHCWRLGILDTDGLLAP